MTPTDETYEVRYRSTGQEWTPWEADTAAPCIQDVLFLRDRRKVTLHLNTGQKVQWRRKP